MIRLTRSEDPSAEYQRFKAKFHVKIVQEFYATMVKLMKKTGREIKTGLKSVRKAATKTIASISPERFRASN